MGTELDFWRIGVGLEVDQALYWMDKYCRENPLSRTITGALKLFKQTTGY